MTLHVLSTYGHRQEGNIVLYSLWYRHTETSEWSKITKIQFYKYEHIVVKLMCEFFGCDYCLLKKNYYAYYCIRATCFDSYRIIFRPF